MCRVAWQDRSPGARLRHRRRPSPGARDKEAPLRHLHRLRLRQTTRCSSPSAPRMLGFFPRSLAPLAHGTRVTPAAPDLLPRHQRRRAPPRERRARGAGPDKLAPYETPTLPGRRRGGACLRPFRPAAVPLSPDCRCRGGSLGMTAPASSEPPIVFRSAGVTRCHLLTYIHSDEPRGRKTEWRFSPYADHGIPERACRLLLGAVGCKIVAPRTGPAEPPAPPGQRQGVDDRTGLRAAASDDPRGKSKGG
jgi:hypothetical protein